MQPLSLPCHVQISQHKQCEVKITIDEPPLVNKTAIATAAVPGSAAAAVASGKQPPSFESATMLTSAMVDNADEATIDRMGNVGQWDLVG